MRSNMKKGSLPNELTSLTNKNSKRNVWKDSFHMANNLQSSIKVDSGKIIREPTCAGMNCFSIGSNRLKIILINKIGYFCNNCSHDLLDSKLVEMP